MRLDRKDTKKQISIYIYILFCILTANGTTPLVGSVAATVATAAGDRVGTTPAVVASERASSRRHRGPSSPSFPSLPPARVPRLVASIPARDHGVAKLVRRQALPVVASERALWTLCDNEFVSSRKFITNRYRQSETYFVDRCIRVRPLLAGNPVSRRTSPPSTRKRRFARI